MVHNRNDHIITAMIGPRVYCKVDDWKILHMIGNQSLTEYRYSAFRSNPKALLEILLLLSLLLFGYCSLSIDSLISVLLLLLLLFSIMVGFLEKRSSCLIIGGWSMDVVATYRPLTFCRMTISSQSSSSLLFLSFFW